MSTKPGPDYCGCTALPGHGQSPRFLCPICRHAWAAHGEDVSCVGSDTPITNPQDPAHEPATLRAVDCLIPAEWWLRAEALKILALITPDGAELDQDATQHGLDYLITIIRTGRVPHVPQ